MASRSRASGATSMTKANKTEVNYSRGMQNAHCGKSFRDDTNYCRHFISSSNSRTPNGDGSCTEVAGTISRVYWCRLFSKAQSR